MAALTDVLVRQTKVPEAGRLTLWDDVVTGLILRITPAGVRTWSVLYRWRGIRRRYTLGRYRTKDQKRKGFTIAEARDEARRVLREAASDHDPQGERKRARQEAKRAGSALATVAEKCLAEGRCTKGRAEGRPWRAKTKAEFERLVRQEIIPVLGDLKPEEVTKGNIRALFDAIEKRSPSVAKHTLAVLRLFYQWAAEEDHVDGVPIFPKRGTQSQKRTRVLEEQELRAVIKALDAGITDNPKARPDQV